jgi:hypothetical protein
MTMTVTRSLALTLAFSALAGCAGVPKEHKEQLFDRAGVDLMGAPADRMHLAIKDPRSMERFCKGPGPDFSLTASAGVSLGTQAVGPIPAGGSVGTSSSRGALDLGGRSPAVLLARELFYRACELTLNTNPDSQTAISIYKMTLDAVERIAATQSGAGTLPTTAAPPAAMAGLPPTITNNPAVIPSTSTTDASTTPAPAATTPVNVYPEPQ